MARKKSPSRLFLKRDPAVLEQIVAVALEHPDLGIRRLSRLLKTEGILTSESGIRSILLKKGLHTRKLRQQLLREKHPSEGILPDLGQKETIEESVLSVGGLESPSSVPLSLQVEREKDAKPALERPTLLRPLTPASADGTIKVTAGLPEARAESRPGRKRTSHGSMSF